ncbi:hypothetical protein ABZ154_06800 [Streptomyces sp. NPDC006261]|uniref:hypothetical protein n=1 Tax=Streptomyces sp. NPDC006261 TaxID=3156739 RepID=UPI0033B488F1
MKPSTSPGDGPSSGISFSLTAGTLRAIRERAGKRGVSAYLEAAARRTDEQPTRSRSGRVSGALVLGSGGLTQAVLRGREVQEWLEAASSRPTTPA